MANTNITKVQQLILHNTWRKIKYPKSTDMVNSEQHSLVIKCPANPEKHVWRNNDPELGAASQAANCTSVGDPGEAPGSWHQAGKPSHDSHWGVNRRTGMRDNHKRHFLHPAARWQDPPPAHGSHHSSLSRGGFLETHSRNCPSGCNTATEPSPSVFSPPA